MEERTKYLIVYAVLIIVIIILLLKIIYLRVPIEEQCRQMYQSLIDFVNQNPELYYNFNMTFGGLLP
jgi:hypothetical protein